MLTLRSRYRAQDVGDGERRDCNEERNDAEDVAPSPLLGDMTGDCGAEQRGQDPRQRERCEECGAVSRGGDRTHEDVERHDEEAAPEALKRTPDHENDDV